ncbi:hypothetical protein, partial [Bacillus cereus]
KREGQIPLLPESSCVVFDEGHLVEYAAQKALTYRLKQTMMEQQGQVIAATGNGGGVAPHLDFKMCPPSEDYNACVGGHKEIDP